MFVVSSGFIAVFKTGDNINHNLRILRVLNAQFARATAEEKRLLCKPITVILISIIEAALHDFYYRCNQYRWERVANLADEFISYIRVKKISKLSQYIFSAKKHDLFGAADGALYDELELLNKLRNRLHIQNENRDLEADESAVFTIQRKELAERVLEQVLKTLSQKYPRPDHIAGWVRDFECDWVERVRA